MEKVYISKKTILKITIAILIIVAGLVVGVLIGYFTEVYTSDAYRSVRLYLRLRAAEFGLRSGHRSAEGFRVLGVTQMHCLPEAGR